MKRIGKYEIVKEIGFGGMGIVYKARVPLIDEEVAVKVFSPGPGSSPSAGADEEDELRRRFVREAKILWGLKHPHIIGIRDIDQAAGTPFIVMDYCPSSLAAELGLDTEMTRRHKRRIGEEKVRQWLEQILSGLAFLHSQKVVHRDIKPANILLDAAGRVKISDFGIARKIGLSRMTQTMYIGTPDFSAPEQVDAKRVDHRADLWAVGMLGYLLLTGQHAFMTRFQPPCAVNGQLRRGWDDWFDRATAQAPGSRYEDARQMAAELASIFDDRPAEPPARPQPAPPPAETRPAPRHRLRSQPVTLEDLEEARRVFSLNSDDKPLAYIDNQFEDHGDGTVSDHATGLMWQQSGSDDYMKYPDARRYVEQLNRSRFAGRADWRLPTVDELCSLLTPAKQGKLYIDPVFDDKQWWCWSADQRSSGSAWLVRFNYGLVYWSDHDLNLYVRAVHTRQ